MVGLARIAGARTAYNRHQSRHLTKLQRAPRKVLLLPYISRAQGSELTHPSWPRCATSSRGSRATPSSSNTTRLPAASPGLIRSFLRFFFGGPANAAHLSTLLFSSRLAPLRGHAVTAACDSVQEGRRHDEGAVEVALLDADLWGRLSAGQCSLAAGAIKISAADSVSERCASWAHKCARQGLAGGLESE